MSSQYRVVIANRIEEFHARKSRFINYCYQLDKGPFTGKTEVLYDSALTLTRRSVDCTILERGKMPNSLRAFTFHSNSNQYVRNGITFQAGDVSASSTGNTFITMLRRGCQYCSLVVNDSFAKKLLSENEWHSYQKIMAEDKSISIKQSAEFPFIVEFLNKAMDALANGTLLADADRDIRAIQQELLRGLVLLIDSAQIESMRANSNHRLFNKATKIVMDTRVKPLAVEELAKRVGTSRRNLEHIFQLLIGITPKQFIQNVRLNRIHEDLLAERNLSVLGVAKRYGINHMGHFSTMYKALFKELPSETRARAAAMELA